MSDYNTLVSAAVHAVGAQGDRPLPDYLSEVQEVAVELAFTVRDVDQAIRNTDSLNTFDAFLEKVEIEPNSRRGILTLRPDSSGASETVRTEQEDNVAGALMIARARELTGRWVRVYRYNEQTAAGKKTKGMNQTMRMVARLLDLGEGALSVTVARDLVLADADADADADGDMDLARTAWQEGGCRTTA